MCIWTSVLPEEHGLHSPGSPGFSATPHHGVICLLPACSACSWQVSSLNFCGHSYIGRCPKSCALVSSGQDLCTGKGQQPYSMSSVIACHPQCQQICPLVLACHMMAHVGTNFGSMDGAIPTLADAMKQRNGQFQPSVGPTPRRCCLPNDVAPDAQLGAVWPL